MRLFVLIERATSLYPMPLRETTTTTSRRCVLRDEHRVPLKRRLLPIIPWRGGCQPLRNEIPGVSENGGKTFFVQIRLLLLAESETLAKG